MLANMTDIREIKVLGDWAFIRNYIEITITPPDGEAMRRKGYTLSILRKQSDGKWVLWRGREFTVLITLGCRFALMAQLVAFSYSSIRSR